MEVHKGDHNTQDREDFNDIIYETGLIEISFLDQQFTWSNMREYPCLAKLDRVLISDAWETRFGLSKVYSIPRPTQITP